MNRSASWLLAIIALALAAPAQGGVGGVDTKPLMTAAKPARPQWRVLSLQGGRELIFSNEAPGRSGLTFACKPGDARFQIRALIGETATTPAIRLSAGGFVRVYFSRPDDVDGREGVVVARASAKDELLESFRITGRIRSGGTPMIAQSAAEKEAIKAFFAACAGQSRAGL